MFLTSLWVGSQFEMLLFAESSSNCQVRTFLEGLDGRAYSQINSLLTFSAEHGPPRNTEKVEKLPTLGCWEFKAYQTRVFWDYATGGRILLLYGFTKKKQKTPSVHLRNGERLLKIAQSEIPSLPRR